MPKEKSAGAIIFREEPSSAKASDGQGEGKKYYLLLHYAPSGPGRKGHWEYPKGHIEEKETEEETIKREVKQDTAIDEMEIIPGFKEYIKYFFRRSYGLKGEARKKAPWVFKLVVFFTAKTFKKEITLSNEHDDFVWLPYEEALKKLTYKNAKELLKKANKYIQEHKI